MGAIHKEKFTERMPWAILHVCDIKHASMPRVVSIIFDAIRGNVDRNDKKCNSSGRIARLNAFSNRDIRYKRFSKAG